MVGHVPSYLKVCKIEKREHWSTMVYRCLRSYCSSCRDILNIERLLEMSLLNFFVVLVVES